MESFIKEFQYFCVQLQLSAPVVDKANAYLQNITPVYLQCGQMISKTALFVCIVFIAVQDTQSTLDSKQDENNCQPEITVSQLLEAADINIMDFFAVTCFLKKNYTLSENAKQSLIALERKYLIVSALYDKFESMTSEIFYGNSEDSHQEAPLQAQAGGASRLLKNHRALCWMLFLVAKAKVLWHRQELLATFHLLLCCIGEVVKVTPSFLLLPPFDSVVAKNESSLTILEVLSNHFRTRFEEVRAVHEGWLHVASELNIGSKFPQIQDLQLIYGRLYFQNGDVDESQFLTRNWHLLPINSEQSFSPRKNPPASVWRTLDMAEALRTILHSAPDDLSLNLKLCIRGFPQIPPSLLSGGDAHVLWFCGSGTENKWSQIFSSSNAEQVKSYSRRVTEDVYDHMDTPGPKKLSTSPEIDVREIIHQGATKMFQGIQPTPSAHSAGREGAEDQKSASRRGPEIKQQGTEWTN